MNDHDNHQTMEREIAELSALERMRKRAALQQMMTAERAVCEVCLHARSPRQHWHWFHMDTPAFVGDAPMNCSAFTFVAIVSI